MISRNRSNPIVRFNVELSSSKKSTIRVFAIYRYRIIDSNGNLTNKRLKYSTGVKGPTKLWNPQNQRFKLSTQYPNMHELNDQLDSIAKVIRTLFKSKDCPAHNLKKFKNQIDLHLGYTKHKTDSRRLIINHFHEYIRSRENDVETSILTIRRLKTSLNIFNEWLEHRKTPELQFSDFDKSLRDEYVSYLFRSRKRTLSPTTVCKYLRDLKMVLEDAYHMEFINRDGVMERLNPSPYFLKKGFLVKRLNATKHWLKEKELEQLYNYDLSDSPRLHRVRNIFLQAAYSGGLRISDIFRVKPENFKSHSNGYLLTLHTYKGRQSKASTKVVIPIKDKSLKLWQESNFTSYPILSEQKLNDYIKELLEIVGIDRKVEHITFVGNVRKIEFVEIFKHISFHSARYSFINICLHERGLQPNEIMGITGQTLKTLLGYVRNSELENAVNIFDKF